ncbi:hypothetical protein SLA2020_150180 [Shorea laevis]
MLAWDNPWSRSAWDNKVYTEIRDVNHFHNMWGAIRNIMRRLPRTVLYHRDTFEGLMSTVLTGSFTSPVFEAVLTLPPEARFTLTPYKHRLKLSKQHLAKGATHFPPM